MTGIYMIRFGDDENAHFYIGQSVDIGQRKRQHLSELRNGIHVNPYMQSVFNKYGEKSMTFEVLCECVEEKLNELEEYYIYTMCTFVGDNSYGLNLNTGGGGHNISEETRAKLSEAKKGNTFHKGKKHSAETIAKMSEAHKSKNLSAETIAKMREAAKDKKHSEETRAKISEANKGRKLSDETRAKMSEAKKGHTVSDETRAKISKAKRRE